MEAFILVTIQTDIMKNIPTVAPQEKAERIVAAVLKYLHTIPDFKQEYEELGEGAMMNIQKSLERIVVSALQDMGFADAAQTITKRFLSDLTHRPGLRQGFFDAMESEDRGNLVQEIFDVVVQNR